MTKILVDTDILIDISRGINTAFKRLQQEEIKHKLCISIITQMELIVGCRNNDYRFITEINLLAYP